MKRLLALIALAGFLLSIVPAPQADAATCLGNSGTQRDGSGGHHKDSAACK